jgi:hypothetical protein
VIEHPAGEETQWDWLELPDPPKQWGFGDTAHLLVGVLPHSSRWRGWIAECEDQPHLIEGLHQVAVRLGGLTQRWRFDRMATVCHPGSGRITASFGPVALHYQVGISICPSRHAWRKGAVEKSAHTIAQRWWRTLADDITVAAAQASLDRICVTFDARTRTRDQVRTTVGELADARNQGRPRRLGRRRHTINQNCETRGSRGLSEADQPQHDDRGWVPHDRVEEKPLLTEWDTPLIRTPVVVRVRIGGGVLHQLRQPPVDQRAHLSGHLVILLIGDLQPDQPVARHAENLRPETGGQRVVQLPSS